MEIREIIVHCSATPEGREHDVEDITRWHKAKGWSDCGYHFIITLDGGIQKGRDIRIAGAHCKGRNQGSIGICYIGGMTEDMSEAKDTRTDCQKESINRLIDSLRLVYGQVPVYGHRDFSSKQCPSYDAHKEHN